MKKTHKILSNIVFTCLILMLFFGISLYVENVFKAYSLIPAIFTLAVFLVTLVTGGYVYGIAAALISVLAVNFAFTFPYFSFNFSFVEFEKKEGKIDKMLYITQNEYSKKMQK